MRTVHALWRTKSSRGFDFMSGVPACRLLLERPNARAVRRQIAAGADVIQLYACPRLVVCDS
jgi:hypothetical protein